MYSMFGRPKQHMHPSQVDEIKKWLITPTGLFACGSTITALSATALVLVNKLRAPREGAPARHSVKHSVEELSREDLNREDVRITATVASIVGGAKRKYMDLQGVEDICSDQLARLKSVQQSVGSSAVARLGASFALEEEYHRATIVCACIVLIRGMCIGLASQRIDAIYKEIKDIIPENPATEARVNHLLGPLLIQQNQSEPESTTSEQSLVQSKRRFISTSSLKRATLAFVISTFAGAGIIYSGINGGPPVYPV